MGFEDWNNGPAARECRRRMTFAFRHHQQWTRASGRLRIAFRSDAATVTQPLAFTRPSAMEISDQLTERRLVQDVQHFTQLLVAWYSWREVGAVGLTQSRDERVAVFPVNFTILIAVPLSRPGCFMPVNSSHKKLYQRVEFSGSITSAINAALDKREQSFSMDKQRRFTNPVKRVSAVLWPFAYASLWRDTPD